MKISFRKTLSPTNLILYFELISSPGNNLPKVPEFLASITRFFVFITIDTFPKYITSIFINFVFDPNFLIAFSAANTSSDNNKLVAFEIPFAKDENKTHRILILLSPLTENVWLEKSLIDY